MFLLTEVVGGALFFLLPFDLPDTEKKQMKIKMQKKQLIFQFLEQVLTNKRERITVLIKEPVTVVIYCAVKHTFCAVGLDIVNSKVIGGCSKVLLHYNLQSYKFNLLN